MSDPPALANTILGDCYRILHPLGEGGMGTVYEAQHLRLGTSVAIKVLAPQFAIDPKARDRFKREAKAASLIRHPNVVQITDFGETPDGSVFFAMELLEGRDLHTILRRHAPLPWRRVQHLLAQATDGLAAAHARGIVHRDIKPANVFVMQGDGVRDFVKILDFGIAKILAPDITGADSVLVKNLTGTGEIFGTARYMAPEQAYGSSNDPRVDVYGLGIVAYEMLTGRVPFSGDSAFEIITKHVYEPPRPPSELQSSVPSGLEAVVLRALAKKADDRYPTMDEFGRALRAVDEDEPEPEPRGGTVVLRRRSGTVPSPVATSGTTNASPSPVVLATPLEAEPSELPSSPAPPSPTPAAIMATPAPAASASTADPEQAIASPNPSTSTWRLWTFASIAAICICAISAAGAYLAVASPPGDEPPLAPEPRTAPTSVTPPTEAQAPPPSGPPEPLERSEPDATETSESPADDPTDELATSSAPEQDLEVPDPELPIDDPDASTQSHSPTIDPPAETSPSPRPQPSSSRPLDDQALGGAILDKVKRRCAKVGIGKKVKITLHITSKGRVERVEVGTKIEAIEDCVTKAVGRPSFSGKNPKIAMSPVLGKAIAGCTDPFSTDPKCTPR
ncbi:serine/threonine protein kinase [Paraliomyxa miuraensis]|uniref:serine/threonine protein kinase n=1 Tax=Paraliomyxa miuraensis TaxID=376150 RepID=UPI0022593784|nr:serine/threonine-protein kinase [Paraliomyxa miuraensis]MCX4247868.1 protein kinase [Paraliomyxa miuraensis]